MDTLRLKHRIWIGSPSEGCCLRMPIASLLPVAHHVQLCSPENDHNRRAHGPIKVGTSSMTIREAISYHNILPIKATKRLERGSFSMEAARNISSTHLKYTNDGVHSHPGRLAIPHWNYQAKEVSIQSTSFNKVQEGMIMCCL